MFSDLFRTSFIFYLKIQNPGENLLKLAAANVADSFLMSSYHGITLSRLNNPPSAIFGEANRPEGLPQTRFRTSDYY